MAKMPGLNFFGCMFNHLAYVQYLMILSLILNRFTAVIFPFQYKAVCRNLLHRAEMEIIDLEASILPSHVVQYSWTFRLHLSLFCRNGVARLFGRKRRICTCHWTGKFTPTRQHYFLQHKITVKSPIYRLQNVNKVLNVYLIPSMIVLTLLSTALMIATFIVYISNARYWRKADLHYF